MTDQGLVDFFFLLLGTICAVSFIAGARAAQ